MLHVYGKLIMAKLKSSRLSYNWVISFPSASMFNKTSKYEAEVDDSVVSLISSSLGYTESTYEWNWSYNNSGNHYLISKQRLWLFFVSIINMVYFYIIHTDFYIFLKAQVKIFWFYDWACRIFQKDHTMKIRFHIGRTYGHIFLFLTQIYFHLYEG
jgi:hypothetical protein